MATDVGNAAALIAKAIDEGRPFVFIAEFADGQIEVTGTADTKWLAQVLDVVRGGLPSIKNTPEHQTRIIELS